MDILQERREKIIAFMKQESYKPLRFSELAAVLDVPREDRDRLAEILESLEREGVIYRTKKDRYAIPGKMGLVVGRIQRNERGYGFLVPDDGTSLMFSARWRLAGAML